MVSLDRSRIWMSGKYSTKFLSVHYGPNSQMTPNMDVNMSNLVVKTNRLNTVTQNLSLTEVRIMQLAIVDARETGKGLSTDKPLTISASRYAEAFGVSRQSAYEAIL